MIKHSYVAPVRLTHKIYLLLTTLFFSTSLFAMHSERNLSARCVKQKVYQQLTLALLEEDPTATTELNELLTHKPTPFSSLHVQRILQAIDNFKDVPGFPETLDNIISHAQKNPDTARGFLFEIETALTAKYAGKTVVSFGRRHSDGKGRDREIDIETERLWIECKDIHWEYVTEHRGIKLMKQLADEQRIMDEYNKNKYKKKKDRKIFMLYSKQPIPQEWKEWLDDQKISYISSELMLQK